MMHAKTQNRYTYNLDGWMGHARLSDRCEPHLRAAPAPRRARIDTRDIYHAAHALVLGKIASTARCGHRRADILIEDALGAAPGVVTTIGDEGATGRRGVRATHGWRDSLRHPRSKAARREGARDQQPTAGLGVAKRQRLGLGSHTQRSWLLPPSQACSPSPHPMPCSPVR